MYDDAKKVLNAAQDKTTSALNTLASTKKNVLRNTMPRFIKSFDRVKHVQLGQTSGIKEIENFKIDSAALVQMQKMADIQDNFLSGAAGVGAGLALTTLTGVGALSFAGLSAIAGPVMLFTAFSASTKADENLEKARVMYADAERVAEKMKTSTILCEAIEERSNMFNELTSDLNNFLSSCTERLE
ncbi:MAG: hypothetical protein IJT21_08320 [Synergistaceae bacterium]|nr:hypothetical protein [Synergistaceae bacterium]